MQPDMPDIANHVKAQTEGSLDWVGMSKIEMPLMVEVADEVRPVTALVEAFVNLSDPKAKGIHMSRLYLKLDELSNESTLNLQNLRDVLQAFVDSHQDISSAAKVTFEFDYHLRRKSLISGKQGWKAYPTSLTGKIVNSEFVAEMTVEVPYSSTCPCSAALARQLIQQQFNETFEGQTQIDANAVHAFLGSTDGIIATPHSQRSIAQVKVKLAADISALPLVKLVDAIEGTLKTPVQAAVKREDEQEFARLNGQNLMFCEDAARRIKATLNAENTYQDFWLRVNHYESLHAHDAVAVASKGVSNGY